MIEVIRFADSLAMSRGIASTANVESILLENIPGALSVEESKEDEDRNGVDWWVQTQTPKRIAVDAKVRTDDWSLRGQDDLAIETWSVIERRKIGWSRDPKKQTDYTLWLWTDTGRWCLVPFSMLCAITVDFWEGWIAIYKVRQQRTSMPDGQEYHSECVFVPRKVIWKEIYLRFSGVTESIPNKAAKIVATAIQPSQLLLFPGMYETRR
jgi:hypothetical protein